MNWALVWNYLPYLLHAAGTTLLISAMAIAGGTVLGLVLALARSELNRWVGFVVAAYIWLVRGTPLLLQIFVVYYWLPGLGIKLAAFPAGVMVLALNATAYYADIFRSALQTVPSGQVEAALALGLPWLPTMRRIVIPQAFVPALPPYIGQSITVVKNSSLVSVISVQELMFTSESIYSSTYRVVETIGVAGVLYLGITSILQVFQIWMEHRIRASKTRVR
ncbi:amino acid ABC transporter permease [Komagataeibacter xylinus]|uniref:Amino acid ABC transporter permease n=1 Tax=Komagataeibacter xylinus TaxID=28448 RepID=A0A857FP57_KOMXY|nr:amino acid ABC transporter permease [Komagataeibacter xylinus]QHC35299.1 amino acid ABC transporter permease [Komagataeibacter xylinus]